MGLCHVCKIRPATIHYTEVVNNAKVTLDLCARCAEEKGITVENGGGYGLGDLVASLIDGTVGDDTDRIGKVRCPTCGYEYSDFRRIGRLGCPDCYEAFEAQLVPLLRQVHGSTRHGGKKPVQPESRVAQRRRVAELKEELTRAVASEDYERAAQLRDEIHEMETRVEDAAAEETDAPERDGEA